jgi:hypothetical protein
MSERHRTLALEHARKAGWEDPIIVEVEECIENGSSPASGEAGVMARVRSEEPPDEPGQYWLEEFHPRTERHMEPQMKDVFYGPPQTLVVRPGPGHGKPVEEVDGLWTGPIPEPKQISERREAP